ncbi:uncharacterized protein TrAFT101_004255 [Trichoderma asperellum]|uniref:uncharacterized protein n=1 Tax=Trichoderma asperellum TaxID=101201 RepID=UPI00332831A9|nr:hypothetical protein TrAFT101_004255 [Trichoderma asperellum]
MRLGWKQTQPNNSHVDAQTDISLPHALTAPLAMFPAWNFRTPSGQDDRGYCFELWATISGAQPKPALPHDRVLRSKCPARRRDPGSNSALPSSKKQVREHHPRHETASGACHSGPVFCRKSQIGCTIPAGSCRLAPLTLIRHLVPPKASADVHNVPGAQPALHQQRARNKTIVGARLLGTKQVASTYRDLAVPVDFFLLSSRLSMPTRESVVID